MVIKHIHVSVKDGEYDFDVADDDRCEELTTTKQEFILTTIFWGLPIIMTVIYQIQQG